MKSKIKINKLYLLIILSLLFFQCSLEKSENNDKVVSGIEAMNEIKLNVIVDISTIVNKSIREIESIWGRAEKLEIVNGYPCKKSNCKKAYFQGNKYEVIFKDGKANRIIINEPPSLAMNSHIIQSLGLEQVSPSFSNPSTVIRWNNISGLKEVSFFNNGEDEVFYILVIVSDSE